MPTTLISGNDIYGGLVQGAWGNYNSDEEGLLEVDSRDVMPLLTIGFALATADQITRAKKSRDAREKVLEKERLRLEKEQNDPKHPHFRDPNLPSDPRFQMTNKEAAEAAAHPKPVIEPDHAAAGHGVARENAKNR